METSLIKCRVDEDECGKASQRRLQKIGIATLAISNSGKEKKMETRFQKLERAAGDGQTCSLLGSATLQRV
jgi:hypothetical protein